MYSHTVVVLGEAEEEMAPLLAPRRKIHLTVSLSAAPGAGTWCPLHSLDAQLMLWVEWKEH
jgi:hypothetical protein